MQLAALATAVLIGLGIVGNAPAQDDAVQQNYPLAVAIHDDQVVCVDLNLPGVWIAGETRELMIRGRDRLREPLNRPRCIALQSNGQVFVGDSATRDVYVIESADAEPVGLSDGQIGIPMALAIDEHNACLYVGDAEKRAVFRVPIAGGTPKLIARVNARGLALDDAGGIWAVTPDDATIVRIDLDTKAVETIVTGRPFAYPNGLVWAGDHGYVTDGYGKCIWRFTRDGNTEPWHHGDPLVGPVGIAIDNESIYVADPKQKQVFQFDRQTKEHRSRL